MEEIDLVKYKKQLGKQSKKEELKTNAGKHKLLTKTALLSTNAFAVTSVLNGLNLPLSILAVISSIITLKLTRYYQKDIREINYETYTKIYNETMTIIKESDIFKECNYEYKDYLKKLSIFFKSLKIQSPLDVALFNQNMLDDGYLSYDNHHEYKKFKKNNEFETSELLGCRVVTGKSVCRHMASFLTDLEKEIGNDSFNIPITIITASEIIKDINIINNPLVNHLITGIREGEQVYGYDPTMRSIVNLNGQESILKIIKLVQPNQIYGTEISIDSLDNRNIYILKDIITNKPEYQEALTLLNKDIEFKEIDHFDILGKTQTIKKQYQENTDEVNDFYNETKQQLIRLKELSEHIAPLSDKKVKHLILK